MNKRWLWILGLGALLLFYLKRWGNKSNDLTEHFKAQEAKQGIGNVATWSQAVSLSNYPLASIGNTPMAGVNLDPFNPENPLAQPRNLETDQWSPSSSPVFSFDIKTSGGIWN